MFQRNGFLSLIFLLFLPVFSVIGCSSTAELPSTINIEQPSPDLPAEIAAFSGIWQGRFYKSYGTCRECDVSIASILVVEKINSETARLIISIGHIPGYGKGGYYHVTSDVLPGPSVKWTDPEGNTYKYIMNKGLNSITGLWKLKKIDETIEAIMIRKRHD